MKENINMNTLTKAEKEVMVVHVQVHEHGVGRLLQLYTFVWPKGFKDKKRGFKGKTRGYKD